MNLTDCFVYSYLPRCIVNNYKIIPYNFKIHSLANFGFSSGLQLCKLNICLYNLRLIYFSNFFSSCTYIFDVKKIIVNYN